MKNCNKIYLKKQKTIVLKNCQIWGTLIPWFQRKMSWNGLASVKHSEAMSDEIITAMSTACGASIFLFELF